MERALDGSLLRSLLAAGLVGGAASVGAGAPGPELGPPVAFTFEALVERAAAMARAPHQEAPARADAVLEKIDYDAHWKIRFRPERAVRVAGGKVPIRFFHLGRFFKRPTRMHLVEGGRSREILYRPDYFAIPDDSPARGLPADIGFAGFQVLDPVGERDWLAFLGAAYFRSSGELDQYGLSARAVAVDTAMPTPEEFPRFTEFWFAPSDKGTLAICALVDGPRITGALRMDIARSGKVTMDIRARHFARAQIDRVGFAPLTSMFWYSELNHRRGSDWRPEIHDSDGLSIWASNGERLWRPLNNPPRVMTSTFAAPDVAGFGLCQRDRAFENYQDDGVFYERRPTVWVEPIGRWGPGAVQLVEIPTDDEIHDNIVAYWLPAERVPVGREIALDYRLHWVQDEPRPAGGGVVTSTRVGAGGVPGRARPAGSVKFAVDFAGGALGEFGREDGVKPVVDVSSGKVSSPYAYPVVGTRRWRAIFDLEPVSKEPVEMRLYLAQGARALTETWLYQFHPEAAPAR